VGATGGWPMVPSAMSTFPSTAWTEVSRARSGGEPAAREALGFLCAAYWRPLYSFARRLGYTTEDAHDLTQGYFALLIEKDYLGDVRLREGRFRGFLLTSFKHFLSKELGRARAAKRGGGRVPVSIDVREASGRPKAPSRRWCTGCVAATVFCSGKRSGPRWPNRETSTPNFIICCRQSSRGSLRRRNLSSRLRLSDL
jgi:hypothetical protein